MSSDINNAEINLLKVKLEAQKNDKTIFFLVGLILGGIIMFFVTNKLNSSNGVLSTQASGGPGVNELPTTAGDPKDPHAGVPGAPPAAGGGPQPQVAAAIKKAKENPNDFDAQITAAGLFFQIGRMEEARGYLQKAYDLKPDGMEYEALVALGQLDVQFDKAKDSEAIFEKAIKLKPQETVAYTGLGTAYRKSTEYDKAIAQFNKALSIQPKDEDSLHELAHAYLEKGDARNAEVTINKLNEVNSKNENIASLKQELDQLKLTGKIPTH